MEDHDGTLSKLIQWRDRALAGVLFTVLVASASGAPAANHIRIATLKTGTLAWELDTLLAHGLDREADLEIELTELASTEGGKIALKGGSAGFSLVFAVILVGLAIGMGFGSRPSVDRHESPVPGLVSAPTT